MRRVLHKTFFNRPTLTVARELLGKFLVRKVGRKTIAGMITEVEAYVGPKDRASHASRGKTERTKVMFGRPGHWYVYLIYGMHHCLNIVTEKEGYPAAILVRSVEGISGPGRVSKHLKIGKTENARPASRKSGLWIEDRGVPAVKFSRGKRIGIDYAGRWKHKPWRFVLEGHTGQKAGIRPPTAT
ncbi:MAG: DNA-3-methyladenine glycosylase [bacterium]|nr:DNA-3-methyladenine glycosylase [bacterium]